MEAEHERKQEEQLKKLIQEQGWHTPRAGFTDAVMGALNSEAAAAPVSYKPLISRTAWGFLALAIGSVCLFMLLGNWEQEAGFLSDRWAEKLTSLMMYGYLDEMTVSNSLVYAFLGLSVFVYIQIFLLKRKMDRQLLT